jgi:hypothetical protein
VCYAIHRGDTATQLAQRITGDARNKYQPWFQIVNAATRFVPKSQYNRLRPGWRACIVKESVESRSEPALIEEVVESRSEHVNQFAAAGSPEPRTKASLRAIGGVDLTVVWLGAAVVVPWLGWRILEGYFGRRRAVVIVMRHFADRFVREFERPLIRQDAAEPPVRSQVRFRPRRARLDILLAPGTGRRYPNLSDHKKNVEYDVVRVLHLLADESFVGGPLYTQGGWVVVPLHFKVGPKQPGVTCISSF